MAEFHAKSSRTSNQYGRQSSAPKPVTIEPVKFEGLDTKWLEGDFCDFGNGECHIELRGIMAEGSSAVAEFGRYNPNMPGPRFTTDSVRAWLAAHSLVIGQMAGKRKEGYVVYPIFYIGK